MNEISLLLSDLFLSGKTFINISPANEGSGFVVNCVTGSVFYRINQTQVQWIITNREMNSWQTRSESPLQMVNKRSSSHEVNKSFVSVASYKFTAKKEHNEGLIKCRLFYKGEKKVESEYEFLRVYCMFEQLLLEFETIYEMMQNYILNVC